MALRLMVALYKKKVVIFQDMITNTILAIQAYKTKDIIGASELNVCIQVHLPQ